MKTLVCAILAWILAVGAGAQTTSLADKLAEAGAEWLIGTWTGPDQDGSQVTITYAQEFDGRAGSVHLRGGNMEIKGLIGVDPVSGEVRQYAVTNLGAILTGTWDDDGGGLTFTASWTLPDGTVMTRAYVHEWIDDNTVGVQVFDGPRFGGNTRQVYEMTLRRSR